LGVCANSGGFIPLRGLNTLLSRKHLVAFFVLIPISYIFLILFIIVLIMSILIPNRVVKFLLPNLKPNPLGSFHLGLVLRSFLNLSEHRGTMIRGLLKPSLPNKDTALSILYWGVAPKVFKNHIDLSKLAYNMFSNGVFSFGVFIKNVVIIWFG